MTEINNSPFIKDKEYLLNHDLCDIPGLSEYQETKKENDNKQKEEIEEKGETEEIDIDIDLSNSVERITKHGEELGLEFNIGSDILTPQLIFEESDEQNKLETDNKSKNKIEKRDEDDIYYRTSISQNTNTYLTEIFKIIKNNIEGGIIIMSVENYYFEENFELIAKLYRVIQKDIVKFLVILNKMDLSINPKKDIEKFKGLIMKHFPKCKTFNINLNTFVPLSVNQLQNELLMNKSFKHLIRYHFYNYILNINKDKIFNNKSINKTFIEHLNNINEINNEIISVINELNEEFKGNSDFNLGITPDCIEDKDYDDFEIIESDDFDQIKPRDIIKLFYSFHKNNIMMPLFSEETTNVLNYFKNENFKSNVKQEKKKEEVSENSINRKIMKCLHNLNKKLDQSKFEVTKFKSLINEIKQTIEFLKIYDAILIPFLGASNAGKTTIINGMLGDDILPTDLSECTKKGIIIRYYEGEMTIKKANFKKDELLNTNYYYFEAEKNVIGKGKNQVIDILKGLNYDFADKEEDSFYYLQTKIKIFDELGFEPSLKKKIYLIDFPGFGTNNKFENEIYKKAMGISNSFIFTIKNSIIKDNNNQIALNTIFNEAKHQKKILPSLFIKSCLFIVNNDKSGTISQKDLDRAKEDIKYLIKCSNKDNINICFYNAKYYSKYSNGRNYFVNRTQTFEFEYNNYLAQKRDFYKNPETIKGKPHKNFIEYLTKTLGEKIKKEGLGTMKKSQSTDKNIEEEINQIMKSFNQRQIIENDDISKGKDIFSKIFSFGQEKISQSNILKESNYEEFKNLFNSQIIYINDYIQNDVRKKIDTVLNTLETFFNTDFSEKKTTLKEINDFINKVSAKKNKINETFITIQDSLFQIITKYQDSIIKKLLDKKDNINTLLKNKKFKEIIKEISNEIEINIKDLNKKIFGIINENDSILSKMIEEVGEIIKEFSEGKTSFEKKESFKLYFSSKVGDKAENLDEEILQELISSCKNLSNIYENKGFKEWLYSAFSNEHHLKNMIELTVKSLIKKLEYILILIIEQLKTYIEGIFRSIDKTISLSTITFTNEQLNYWNEIKKFYKGIKVEITSLKNKLKNQNQ